MADLVTLVEAARGHLENQQPFHAELYYRQVLRLTDPIRTGADKVARGEACLFFARRALYQQNIGAAGDWYRQALVADPRASDYRADFVGKVLLPMGMIAAARAEAQRAVAIDPESAKAWLAVGQVEYADGNADASRAARQRAWALLPEEPYLILELALLELDTAHYDRVRDLCAVLLHDFPERRGDALHYLAMVAYREGRHDAAVALYTEAIAAGCSDPASARFNRALPLHSLGRYPEGWADYEARGETAGIHSTPFKRFSRPLWQGEPGRIHLHEEMGWGDTIAMLRYLPFLLERGCDVHLEVRPEIAELVRVSMPDITVVPRALDYPGVLGIPDFDYHAPLLSLPHMFATTVETIPWRGPYLKADPIKVDAFDRVLPSGRRIGLCWSSGIRDGLWLQEYGRRKSVALAQLQPVWSQDHGFVSLQLGPEANEAAILGGAPLSCPLTEGSSWADTAALIETLDLVITVDTAVGHLAGALGKPVWLLMHTEGSWHYMADIDGTAWQHQSPWYPNTKLYRQKRPHEWTDVIERIARDLLTVG